MAGEGHEDSCRQTVPDSRHSLQSSKHHTTQVKHSRTHRRAPPWPAAAPHAGRSTPPRAAAGSRTCGAARVAVHAVSGQEERGRVEHARQMRPPDPSQTPINHRSKGTPPHPTTPTTPLATAQRPAKACANLRSHWQVGPHAPNASHQVPHPNRSTATPFQRTATACAGLRSRWAGGARTRAEHQRWQ